MWDLFDLTAQRARLSPDRVALVDLTTGDTLSYAGLDDRAARAAGMLASLGIEPGDRVAVLCRNRPAFFVLLFACAKLGCILVPLNWRMPAAELGRVMADCQPRLLFHGVEDGATAEALPVACFNLDDGFDARVGTHRPLAAREVWPADDIWYLLYTSGTTGEPKAVLYTYGMAMANYVNLRQGVDLSESDRTLNYLPLFHTAGINLHTLPLLMAGGEVLVRPGFDADAVLDLIADGRITTFFGVPAVYRQLALHPRFATTDLGGVRRWACGGAPLEDALARRFLDRGAPVCNGMGMTETGPTLFLNDPAGARAKVGSIGKPQILCRVRVADAQGRDVPPGQVGELWVKGAAVTPGYWRQPAATAAAFTEDGWLRTGDLVRQDDDGYYYPAGRLKEMFISGGENVYPVEVENALLRHPGVLEVAVVAMPDAVWGEVGQAHVRVQPGTDVDSLARHCRALLAGYKVPRHFVLVDDFPRTAAGKIQKHRLMVPPPGLDLAS
ncbi:long-chain fatty acid--CoA ligase [Nitrospirillum sp. BR 11828]|uniref:acyl-CoA synthetase n=1 Tax=Nitrospirillum sp. BR 11828 TaxID=3104325 RepID=UPI002AC9FADB|nr:long-chain fatty acid--CoA ligase [Nitrospirillum sp. BR 11828]MDZ5650212.1 long-chain fatty acid--CoA ligase [Nitrospirillum sp. BR 11828]